MAGKKLLDCLKKRDLLNSDKADEAELIQFGERYLLDGRLSDSIDFFEKAQHLEGLNQLRERCIAEGDYFLYHRLFALLAYQQADRPEKVAEVEKLIKLPAKANDLIH